MLQSLEQELLTVLIINIIISFDSTWLVNQPTVVSGLLVIWVSPAFHDHHRRIVSRTRSFICKGAVRRSIKLANFCGLGLVAEENRPMKSLNCDTRYFSRHDSDDKKWQTIRTPTLLCCFIFWPNQHKNSADFCMTDDIFFCWPILLADEIGQLYWWSDSPLRFIWNWLHQFTEVRTSVLRETLMTEKSDSQY